jgi:hypothetical protein
VRLDCAPETYPDGRGRRRFARDHLHIVEVDGHAAVRECEGTTLVDPALLGEAQTGSTAGVRHRRLPAGATRRRCAAGGYYEDRVLRFAGKVRAGFTPHLRRVVFAQLEPLQTSRCPFPDLPNSKTSHWGSGVTADQMAAMRWVKPQLVAQIRFVEWTAEGHLRHAAFLGLRTDRLPASTAGIASSTASTSRT